ncbi:MAG: hypothetical protein IK092_01785, partial [Muribaculaceae bacterium]|nr:hypothetical protein [Muribaculaceae bacterium]
MKKLLLLTMTALCVVSAWAWKPTFIGHRGSYKGVMNTVEAYNNGVDVYGYQGLECDVRVTSDGYYVISHDETTNNVGGNLTVANATLAQLQAETYTQTRGGVTYTGKICTVAEYLDICVEKNVTPVIELKWTTGINNNDMSKFPGLAALIEEKGLTSKAIILTSMKASLEYVRTNYPALKCQFLCNDNWANNFDWIVQWGLMPSIEAGCFDEYTIKRFHDKGIEVAVWTVNSEANYTKYGNMGVAMMTCDYLMPSDMPDLADIDWASIVEPMDPLTIKIDTLFAYTDFRGNLPANFPNGKDGNTYQSAQQAAITADGTFYANNYGSKKLIVLKPNGTLTTATGSNSHGICFDSADNLILRNDGGGSAVAKKVVIYPGGDITAEPITVDYELPETGTNNFITAIGDVMSAEGGIIYHYQNGRKYVTLVKIANGQFVEATTTTGELSFAASTAGVVFPIDENDPERFIYQVRNQGYNLYDHGDKGKYITGSLNTTPPNSNSSVGGQFFKLDGHDMFLYTSGSNYNGGWTVRDMSANAAALATVPPMGDEGYYANLSTGSFFRAVPVHEKSVIIYEYTMGNGYGAYQISTADFVPYNVAVAVAENGTVEANKTIAEEGEIVSLTITPDEGYEVGTITVTPETLELIVDVDENNEFVMPADNVTVTVTFVLAPTKSAISFEAPTGGTMNVYVDGSAVQSGDEVAEGELVTIELIPE